MDPLSSSGAPRVAPPGAVGALVCGILAIVFCWFPLAGLGLGIIAIVLASRAKKAVAANPATYLPGGMGTAGFVLGIIGTVLSAIYLVVWIVAVTFVSKHPEALDEFNRRLKEEQRLQRESGR